MEKLLSNTQTGSKTMVFRILLVILIVGMLGGGISQLIPVEFQVKQFTRLGYPLYFMNILGTAKVLAALVLIFHRWPVLTVAAYTGAFILSVSAFLSHLASGDPLLISLNPLVLTAISVSCTLLDPSVANVGKAFKRN